MSRARPPGDRERHLGEKPGNGSARALALLATGPGLRTAEIAKRLALSHDYIGRVLDEARAEGLVRYGPGRLWRIVESERRQA